MRSINQKNCFDSGPFTQYHNVKQIDIQSRQWLFLFKPNKGK